MFWQRRSLLHVDTRLQHYIHPSADKHILSLEETGQTESSNVAHLGQIPNPAPGQIK